MTSRLEVELREQPDALARLLDRQLVQAREVAKLFHLPTTRFDPTIGVALICADKLIQRREAKHKL